MHAADVRTELTTHILYYIRSCNQYLIDKYKVLDGFGSEYVLRETIIINHMVKLGKISNFYSKLQLNGRNIEFGIFRLKLGFW